MKFIKDLYGDFSQFSIVFDNLSKCVFHDTKIGIAVSGGPDSMFVSILMYKFFLDNNFDLKNLFFIHCNHKTRKETDSEELFIRSFFDGLNLNIAVYDGNSHKEDTLRQWRYSVFNDIVKKNNIQYLVTGHNLTDRIESTFMNMLRGSGINGFLSMKFIDMNNLLQNAKILRPILSLTKKEIQNFCDILNIPYVVDQTNFVESTSLRNYIRLSLFQGLEDKSNKNNGLTCTFFDSMKQIYDDIEKNQNYEFIGQFIPIKKSDYRNADFAYLWEIPFGFIDEKLLLTIFKKFNIYSDVSKNTLQDFLLFFSNAKQGFKYINGIYFFISNGKIYIIKAKENFLKKYIEKDVIIDNIGFIKIGKETVNIDKKEYIGCILRYPKVGDKVGNKSWGEFCINKKIPVFWRNFIPVVQLENGCVEGFCDVVL